MADLPYVQFYTSDFLAGVGGMSAATRGVYITLLCLMYEAEAPLSQSWEALARRCGCTVPAFRRAVRSLEEDGKIVVGETGIWSPKCNRHIAQRRERQRSATSAAKKRWEKIQQKQCPVDATAMRTQCQPEPEYIYSVETNVSTATHGVARPPDPVKAMFDAGVALLGNAGVPQERARALLGRWRRDHGEAAVIVALGRAQREGAIDPVSFIEGALRHARAAGRKQGRTPEIGEERRLDDGRVIVWAGAVDQWVEVRE